MMCMLEGYASCRRTLSEERLRESKKSSAKWGTSSTKGIVGDAELSNVVGVTSAPLKKILCSRR